jgi:hypothetical protein
MMHSSHLSSHQFSVVIKGGCEARAHDIQIALDVHPNWVVFQVDIMNAFNSIFHKTIF